MDSLKQKQNNLVLYRRRMAFTQKEVARLLGHRDISMVSHYEHGRALPPLGVALGLEIIYRVPVAFLFPRMYDDIKKQIRTKEELQTAPGQQSLFRTLTPSAHELSS
jgi:transcriptional regulator with XRE-family HTH domain